MDSDDIVTAKDLMRDASVPAIPVYFEYGDPLDAGANSFLAFCHAVPRQGEAVVSVTGRRCVVASVRHEFPERPGLPLLGRIVVLLSAAT